MEIVGCEVCEAGSPLALDDGWFTGTRAKYIRYYINTGEWCQIAEIYVNRDLNENASILEGSLSDLTKINDKNIFTKISTDNQSGEIIYDCINNTFPKNIYLLKNKNTAVKLQAKMNGEWKDIKILDKVYNCIDMSQYGFAEQLKLTWDSNSQVVLNEIWLKGTVTTDKSQLQKLYDTKDQYKENAYVESTWLIYKEALIVANEVLENPYALQSEIDQAYTTLEKAIQQLEYIEADKVDKGDLAALIKYAKEAKEETSYKYVVAKVREMFEKALSDAIEANDKPDATRAEVDAAYDALLKTVHLLEFKGNMERLESLVVTARKETKEKYTPGSWAPFEKARQEAEDILAGGNTLQEEVDAARTKLLNAIFGLREVPNKDKLGELLGKVKAMDLRIYSEETASAVKAAYAKAMAVFEDENADQKKVDAAVAALEEAVAAANAEAGDVTKEENTSKKEDGSSKGDKVASDNAGSKGTTDKTAGKSAAKTGDSANAAIPMTAGLVAVLAAVIVWRKKTNRV